MTATLNDVDLASPDNFVDGVPHEWFEVLRREAPAYWHEYGSKGRGFWTVTRHADVAAINRDWESFSSERGGVVIATEGPAADAEGGGADGQNGLMMLMMDPPKHTRYRLLVNKGFTPRMVNELEPHVRELMNKIIDRVIEKGEADFVVDIAAELPLAVICEMMGVPEADWHKIFDWSNRMIGSSDPEYNASMEEVMNASMEMYAYSNALAAEKRGCPADNTIVSKLLTGEVKGEKLSDLEFDLFFLLLAVAGNETTRNLVSHAMLALIENPGERQKLLDDPSKINVATEEFLRWGTPVMNFKRTATKDYELHGQTIKEGDPVTIWYISANRDEAVFADPYKFDVERTPNDHIAFGAGGPHFCLGANLARMEIRIAFEEILRRMPDIELASKPERLRSNFINGIKHMPITFTPAKQELA